MSEEVKDQQENQEAEEAQAPAEEAQAPAEEAKALAEEVQAPAEEAKAPAETKAEESAGADDGASEGKKKKINRLTKAQLEKKIQDLESKNAVKSKYYKHLVERKKELEAS